MKLCSGTLLNLFPIMTIFATNPAISATEECNALKDRLFLGNTKPGKCRSTHVRLTERKEVTGSQKWTYECEPPKVCIEATWILSWLIEKKPINVDALYTSTPSSMPAFTKLITNNATTRPIPKGFELDVDNGYLYVYSNVDIDFHLKCTAVVCVPPKPVTTRPPTTKPRPTTRLRTTTTRTRITQSRTTTTTRTRITRSSTKFITIGLTSSSSQPVTPQINDTTDNGDIDTSAELQTSNTPATVAVSLVVILIATVVVLGFLYRYGFLGKWALLDSYIDRFRARFMGQNPELFRPAVEAEPLRSPMSSAS
ncbi:m09 protein [Murid betaherpesvirus 1]|nr:m09 protein [Murid betaherpesvirus 1]